jgi:hypothetical protein
VESGFGVDEAKVTVLVLREMSHEPTVPPDIKHPHHGCGFPLGSGGGVICREHPRASRT